MRIGTWARLLAVLLATCAGAAAPGRAAAQDQHSARAVLRREGLCPGALVQVSTTFGERFQGSCVLGDARLLVVREGVEQPVLYTAVDSIWMRGSRMDSGTVTGGWVGGSVGAVLGTAYRAAACDFRCPVGMVLYGVGGAVAGTLVGRAAGAVIGGGTRVWIRLYPH